MLYGLPSLPSPQAWPPVITHWHETVCLKRLTPPPATRSEPTQQQQTRTFSVRRSWPPSLIAPRMMPHYLLMYTAKGLVACLGQLPIISYFAQAMHPATEQVDIVDSAGCLGDTIGSDIDTEVMQTDARVSAANNGCSMVVLTCFTCPAMTVGDRHIKGS